MDKRDMLTRMKLKMDSSLDNAKLLIDSDGDGTRPDVARTVWTLLLLRSLLFVFCCS